MKLNQPTLGWLLTCLTGTARQSGHHSNQPGVGSFYGGVMFFKIDKDFKDLLPPLSKQEYNQLRASIVKAKGCSDQIILWRGYIADGHNRYAICVELGFTDDLQSRDLEDAYGPMTKEQVMLWIYENQLGRRNLTFEDSTLMRGNHYHLLKKHDGRQPGQNGQAEGETREILAEKYNVSPKTIQRDAIVASAAPEVIEQFKAGELTKKQVIESVQGDPRLKVPEDAGDQWEPPTEEEYKERKEAAKDARKHAPGTVATTAQEVKDAIGNAGKVYHRWAKAHGKMTFGSHVYDMLQATLKEFDDVLKEKVQ